MIATAALCGLSLVMMKMSLAQTNLASKANLDSELSIINGQIMTYLSSPNDCNANFYGRPLTGLNLNSVNVCSTNTCHGANAIAVLNKTTNGTSSTDGLWIQGSKVRISNIDYSVPSVTGIALSLLTYKVTFQTRLGASGSVSSKMKTLPTKYFYIPVVVSGANILGCPKSWNSTTVY